MARVYRVAAVMLALGVPGALPAQRVIESPQPISVVTSEELENLPGTSVQGLLETTYAGAALLDPGTSLASSIRGNYFVRDGLSVSGAVSGAHIDIGGSSLSAVEVLVGGQYLAPFGDRAMAGVIAMIGYQDNDFGGDGIFELGATTRYGVVPGAALYTGVFFEGAFGGGNSWTIRGNLIPARYPGLDGYFVPQRGLWELRFDAQYEFDPGDLLNINLRGAPYISDRLQIGADLSHSRDGGGTTFTHTLVEGFAAMHFPMESRFLPYVGAFGGYQSITDLDGEGTFGGRVGLRYSAAPTSSVFLEGEYRSFTGDFSENQFGLRLGTSIYAGY